MCACVCVHVVALDRSSTYSKESNGCHIVYWSVPLQFSTHNHCGHFPPAVCRNTTLYSLRPDPGGRHIHSHRLHVTNMCQLPCFRGTFWERKCEEETHQLLDYLCSHCRSVCTAVCDTGDHCVWVWSQNSFTKRGISILKTFMFMLLSIISAIFYVLFDRHYQSKHFCHIELCIY